MERSTLQQPSEAEAVTHDGAGEEVSLDEETGEGWTVDCANGEGDKFVEDALYDET